MTNIVIIGTLDTKPDEFVLLRSELERQGATVTMMDVSTTGDANPGADITGREIAAAVGARHHDFLPNGDRASAIASMSAGAGIILLRLFLDGKVDGVIGMGGSGNTEVASHAMRMLPIGVPKVILSTASISVAGFIGNSDVTLIHSVTDVSGVNFILREQIAQSAAAVVAMASAREPSTGRPDKVVALTMFGITTPGATIAAQDLRARGYEVLVFHTNGTGGRALEQLAEDGVLDAVLDLTPTELADELIGGHRSAGPHRLSGAGRKGLPQVVALGGLDVVNFGALDSIPTHFRGRQLYGHASASTLMRTSLSECAALGHLLATKLNDATGPVAVLAPTRGFSSLDRPGQPFYDPAADKALIAELRATLDPRIDFVEVDAHVNDPAFAALIAARMDKMYKESHDLA